MAAARTCSLARTRPLTSCPAKKLTNVLSTAPGEEVFRVMQLDFDQAYVRSLPAQRSAQAPSPLLTKRDPNAHSGADDEQPASKRTRIGVMTPADLAHN